MTHCGSYCGVRDHPQRVDFGNVAVLFFPSDMAAYENCSTVSLSHRTVTFLNVYVLPVGVKTHNMLYSTSFLLSFYFNHPCRCPCPANRLPIGVGGVGGWTDVRGRSGLFC